MTGSKRPPHDDRESAPDELVEVPEGGLSRGLRLGAALAGAVGKAAARNWLRPGSRAGANAAERADGERLAGTLGSLKGLSMKLGQMLSYVDLQTPEGWKQALSRLQHESPPLSHEMVSEVVEQELGRSPEAIFAAWDPKPIAAASIGQVHRARLRDGGEVAVKVRYPNIDRIMRQDLDSFELVSRFGGFLMPKLDSAELIAELRERFLEECDYRKEAESQILFRDFFESEEGVVIPRVHAEYCSERVLTSDLIDGQRFDDFARRASPTERNHAARLIHNFAFKSIFGLAALNCDPHPGNYLFPSGGVAFLDFGCVRRFEAGMLQEWRRMLRAALEQDHKGFRGAVVALGLAEEGGSFDFEAHYAQYLYLIRPWLSEKPAALTPDFVTRTYRTLLVSNPNRTKLKMPRELLFVNRLQWGLYSVLAQLGSTQSLRDEILDIVYDAEEARPPPFSESEVGRYLRALHPEQ
ncbi:MAG TPA: AarF/ABC1/UbiB kinase family protein [Polyangiaceae bacterium]